jgi:hypothetical protein
MKRLGVLVAAAALGTAVIASSGGGFGGGFQGGGFGGGRFGGWGAFVAAVLVGSGAACLPAGASQ